MAADPVTVEAGGAIRLDSIDGPAIAGTYLA